MTNTTTMPVPGKLLSQLDVHLQWVTGDEDGIRLLTVTIEQPGLDNKLVWFASDPLTLDELWERLTGFLAKVHAVIEAAGIGTHKRGIGGFASANGRPKWA